MADHSRDRRPLVAPPPDEEKPMGLVVFIVIATGITLGAIYFLTSPSTQRVVDADRSAHREAPAGLPAP
jgi:hypothetical protein